ncbi:MAG: anaerobic ribonucleoside-triphosphate reductase activating protein [Clostridia bacterium]|nr:anaerobic ribonucleoside-triphosphate reductase activating protein [Clostridia bacterium]
MYYGNIKSADIANGPGVRVTLFVSGCTHHCKNCFNPETWNFEYGKPFTAETEEQIIKLLEANYIEGLTLLGGEPMEPSNQKALLPFVKKVKEKLPNKTVWCYTGFVFDKDLISGGRAHTPDTDELLSLVDVLVDGPFVESLKNLMLKFRGSSNQRLIDMAKTRETGQVVTLA